MILKILNSYKQFATKVTSFIYKLLPNTLFARFILIITVPTIVIQLVTISLFYYRHWYNVSTYTSQIIVQEVVGLINSLPEYEFSELRGKYLSLNYSFYLNEKLKTNKLRIVKELEIFQNILKRQIQFPAVVDLIERGYAIRVQVQLSHGLLIIQFPSKMLRSPTTYIFVLWILFLTLILLTIAITFSKKQIRSILELSKAANNFGKNISTKISYRPSGASEIRQAGIAFIRMQERIERQIHKRTQMLAMISHDLKTPLTSLRLQVALLPDESIATDMLHDIERMDQMIGSYLDFARGEGGESFKTVQISEWLQSYVDKNKFYNLKITYGIIDNKLTTRIKEQAFQRAIDNILSNAAKYSNLVLISLYYKNHKVIIDIEDNGIGISDSVKSLVFTPFYRIDKARSINDTGNVGLGLAVTKEIILGHNGSIKLIDSINLKGLLVRITLPCANY